MKPLCFVLMPFGKKINKNGDEIDFDIIYKELIEPAIEVVGLEPVIANEEQMGGIIHKPMYERLMMCEYAIADLSTSNANVFYELGIRHSFKEDSTILISHEVTQLPFDVNFLRVLPYDVDKLEEAKNSLIEKLLYAKENKSTDSPIYQLLTDVQPFLIEHSKTDIFNNINYEYDNEIKNKLFQARKEKSKDILIEIENSFGNLQGTEVGAIVDLFLSYRSIKAYDEMIELIEKMPKPIAQSLMIQEQLGFALNRLGKQDEAIRVLEAVINNHGKSSETNGILGRAYKDKYTEALKENEILAKGFLKKAINTYLDGFEADFRDAYPGINALTLMDIAKDNRFEEIYPVVLYAVKQKMKKSSDYWDYATLLELYVLKEDKDNAFEIVSDVIAHKRYGWEIETTVNNLNIIRQRREEKGESINWLDEVINNLQ